MTMSDHRRLFLGVCFFISGMCGLIYEVVWSRMLGLVFGNTTFAISTILTAFMVGLALGSLIFGRLIDRGFNPARIYGLLEIGIGVYALLFSRILYIQDQFYFLYQPGSDFMSSSLLLFAFCFFALLIPTVCMGGTLPVLIKYFVTDFAERGVTIGRVYALNTLGAVLGSFLSGYFFMLYLGVSGTIYLAAGLNILIGVAALNLRQISPEMAATPTIQTRPKPGSPANRLLTLAVFISGFAALIYEVTWTRLFALILGSSVYAFSAMLTAFLGGIVLGAYAFAEKFGQRRATLTLLGLVECIIGVYCLLLIPAFNEIMYWSYLIHIKFSNIFWLQQVLKFTLCFYTIIIPTALFGATFPLAAAIFLQEKDRIGSDTGAIYFANTVGSALGSFLTGFLLIPAIGIKNSIVLAVTLNLLIGNLLVWKGNSRMRWLPVVSVAFISLALWVQFDRQLLTSGMFMYNYGENFKRVARQDALLFYGEGTSSIVSVHAYRDETGKGKDIRYVRVNGKTDASTGVDMSTQLLSGHLPMLAAGHRESVAIIGLGSGVTAAAAIQYNPGELYIIEIESEMIKAANYFSDVNRQVLSDPRVKCIIADGRHFIQSSRKKFDVIISEPSNPWIGGIGNLFSNDFYRTARQKLTPDGIFAQWLAGDRTDPAVFKMILKTFQSTFPNASLWACRPGHYILIGYNSGGAAGPDFGLIEKRIARMETDLRFMADLAVLGIASPQDLKKRYLLGAAGVAAMSANAKVNSDNWPLLEFLAPRSFYADTTRQNNDEINRYVTQ